MSNGSKNKISIKRTHFLVELLKIWDHFILVMWQTYILLSGLRILLLWTETPFLGYLKFLKIYAKKNVNKFGYARYGTSGHKNPILKPIYNRYFCHITNIKWSRKCTRIIKKCFFWIFFHYLGLFLIIIPIISLKTNHHP